MSFRPFASSVLAVALLVGCDKSANKSDTLPADAASPPAGQAAPAAPAHDARPAAAPATESQGSHVGRKTREILNAKEAVNDPNWKVVTNEVSGSDPLSVAGSVYNKTASMAGSLGIVQWVNQEKATEGKPPTYAALMDFMKQNPSLELPATKEYQTYGYDETTGEIVILEHKERKATRYRELGLPVDM